MAPPSPQNPGLPAAPGAPQNRGDNLQLGFQRTGGSCWWQPEIPRPITVWMVIKPVLNNGISTTNFNWWVFRIYEPSTVLCIIYYICISWLIWVQEHLPDPCLGPDHEVFHGLFHGHGPRLVLRVEWVSGADGAGVQDPGESERGTCCYFTEDMGPAWSACARVTVYMHLIDLTNVALTTWSIIGIWASCHPSSRLERSRSSWAQHRPVNRLTTVDTLLHGSEAHLPEWVRP